MAFPGGAGRAAAARSHVLEARADEFAEPVSRENGKPAADARLHDVGFLVGTFRFFIVRKRPQVGPGASAQARSQQDRAFLPPTGRVWR